MHSKSQQTHERNILSRITFTKHISNNVDHAFGSAFLTSLLKDHLHVWGLFRPIRLQHNWMMTTSFTCSTGLGDKLLPLLLPGVYGLLFVRSRERAVCHRWWRVALKHCEEPSYHLYSQQQGERCARRPFGELCQDRGSGVYVPIHTADVTIPVVCLILFQVAEKNSWLKSKLDFDLLMARFFSISLCQNTIKQISVEIFSRTAVHHALWHANLQ